MKAVSLTPSPAYSLAYHEHLNTLMLRWLRTCTPAEARSSYRAAMVLAHRYCCARWLLDARRAGPLSREVTEWLSHELLPVAAARLAPQPLRLAVVGSPEFSSPLPRRPEVAAAVANPLAGEHPGQASIFCDEGVAVAWLIGRPA